MSLRSTRRAFLQTGLAAGAAATLPQRILRAAPANDEINLGLIGCGGRGTELMKMFHKIDGVNVAGLCDPDEQHTAALKKVYGKARAWTDLRDMLDDKSIDVVVVAACNHWHALAAIWAMEAGKDVYVEKPLANTHWEGRQLVAAVDRYDRICQVGTQQRAATPCRLKSARSSTTPARSAPCNPRVNRYGVRGSIGKRPAPLEIPRTVDFGLWLGPAQDEPIRRNELHYDWHWVWNTGAGEMGNWGVHILDDLRNNVFQDKVQFPSRIAAGGGRVLWDDAGETPNLHFAYFDAGIPVVMALCNLPAKRGGDKPPGRPGPASGYVAYCEGGRLEGQRGSAVAYDAQGKVIRKFNGLGGNDLHQQNFIDAVRSRDASTLRSGAEVGLHSTAWCHLANVAYLAGETATVDRVEQAKSLSVESGGLVDEVAKLLAEQGVDPYGGAIKLSSTLEFDPERDRFAGDDAQAANDLMTPAFRAPFAVPEIAAEPAQQART